MKKLIFTISTILLISISVFAQIDSKKTIEWKLLAPEYEEFSVEAPEDVQTENYDEQKISNRFTAKNPGTYIFIFSDDLIGDYDKTAMKFIEVNQKAELEKQINQTEMKFSFSDDEGFFHNIYTVKTKERAYIFHLVSEVKNDPNVDRFYKSLKIKQKPANAIAEKKFEKTTATTIQKPVENSSSNTISNLPKIVPETGSGNGVGFGNGVGSGEGSGYGTGRGSGFGNGSSSDSSSSENKPVQNKALNIIFKPKPSYTDFARYYGITGNIRIRTTFRNNGTIDSAVPVSRLPFGLTKSAINAAKQMRFEPQTVNGTPVSVTKVVVFGFVIY